MQKIKHDINKKIKRAKACLPLCAVVLGILLTLLTPLRLNAFVDPEDILDNLLPPNVNYNLPVIKTVKPPVNVPERSEVINQSPAPQQNLQKTPKPKANKNSVKNQNNAKAAPQGPKQEQNGAPNQRKRYAKPPKYINLNENKTTDTKQAKQALGANNRPLNEKKGQDKIDFNKSEPKNVKTDNEKNKAKQNLKDAKLKNTADNKNAKEHTSKNDSAKKTVQTEQKKEETNNLSGKDANKHSGSAQTSPTKKDNAVAKDDTKKDNSENEKKDENEENKKSGEEGAKDEGEESDEDEESEEGDEGEEDEEDEEDEEEAPPANLEAIMVSAGLMHQKRDWAGLKKLLDENPAALEEKEALEYLIEAECSLPKPNLQNLRRCGSVLISKDAPNPWGNYALAYYNYNAKKPNVKRADKYLETALKAKKPPKAVLELKTQRIIKKLIIPFAAVIFLLIAAIVFMIKKKRAARLNIDEIAEKNPSKPKEEPKKEEKAKKDEKSEENAEAKPQKPSLFNRVKGLLGKIKELKKKIKTDKSSGPDLNKEAALTAQISEDSLKNESGDKKSLGEKSDSSHNGSESAAEEDEKKNLTPP